MITTPLKYTTDLDRDPVKVTVPNLLHTADQQAHRVCVTVCRGSTRQIVDLTKAAITGYFIRSDNTTVLIPGSVENNAAVCTLPAACYAKAGGFALLMKAELDGVVHTIFHGVGALARSQSEALVDPEQVMPPLEELLAIIRDAEQVANLTVEAQTLPSGRDATASYQDGVLTLGLPRGDSAEQRQTDWNDNDPESPLHILNRTHWMQSGNLTMVPETTLTSNGEGQFMLTERPAGFPLADSDCTVTWNGVDHVVKAQYAEMESITYIPLGNSAAMGGENTGEPFFLMLITEDDLAAEAGAWGVAYDLSGTGTSTITLKIAGPTEIIHTLDEKYLPRAMVQKYKEQLNLINGEAEGSLRGLTINEDYAQGPNSIAFGTDAHAQGTCAVALGEKADGSGLCSFAHGYESRAWGAFSYAGGCGCVAREACSHAEGRYTSANAVGQHAEGLFNINDLEKKYLHIAGNGTDENKRSNAYTLDWSGNGWFAGTVECSGVILTSPGGTRYKLTVADDGTLTTTAL